MDIENKNGNDYSNKREVKHFLKEMTLNFLFLIILVIPLNRLSISFR